MRKNMFAYCENCSNRNLGRNVTKLYFPVLCATVHPKGEAP